MAAHSLVSTNSICADWLTSNGLKGKANVKVPQDVVDKTAARYQEAYVRITGKTI